MTTKQYCLISAVLLICTCLLGSCAQGPEPVRPGTPAFFWATANSAWKAGDFVKTNDTLNQIANTQSEFSAKARVWQLVVASGLVQGYTDLADAYDNGAKYNREDKTPFREQVRVAMSTASQLSVQAAETFQSFLKDEKTATVAFDFPFPAGSTAEPAQMPKLKKGILLHGAEAEGLQSAMLQRGVVLAAMRAAGLAPDTPNPAEAFSKGAVREQFLTGMAGSLFEQSKIFGPKKLDQPQRLQALCTLAQQALGLVPPTAKTKELQGKIQGAMGKKRMT